MNQRKKPRKPRIPFAPMMIGWRECFALPALGIHQVIAKTDTGARTSALHAVRLQHFEREGKTWVRFSVHPHKREARTTIRCEAPLLELREVRSSNGKVQMRPVIVTELKFQDRVWPIELTLTNRSSMGFRMLLGREAMYKRLFIDPSRSFLGGHPEPQDVPLLQSPTPVASANQESSPAVQTSSEIEAGTLSGRQQTSFASPQDAESSAKPERS